MRSFPCLLSLVLVCASSVMAGSLIEDRRVALQVPLKIYFDQQVEDIDSYTATVNAECSAFPEGTLFPYILPALAYGNLALRNPEMRDESIVAIESLLAPALHAFRRAVGDPGTALTSLETYQDRATEMGQINLALSLYAHLGGRDSNLLALNRHFTRLLYQALEANEGRPLQSYPYLSWPFDTIPCIVSMLLQDPDNSQYREIAQRHLDWIASEGRSETTGLPYGEAHHRISRGCDLSLRLPLIRHFAPKIAESYYIRYLDWHWSDFTIGFREWPKGVDRGIDIDSGPIIQNIGLSATGNGVAAVLAFGDDERAGILLGLLEQRDLWVALYRSSDILRARIQREFEDGFVPIDTSYFTGFLYGDAALFYMLTWEDYDLAKKTTANLPEPSRPL